jgi:hypothetical protein
LPADQAEGYDEEYFEGGEDQYEKEGGEDGGEYAEGTAFLAYERPKNIPREVSTTVSSFSLSRFGFYTSVIG